MGFKPIENEITREAPAKINLGLEILSRREDGYHELNTVFLKLTSPSDRLTFRPAKKFALTTSDKSLPADDKNIVMRAVTEYCSRQEMALPPIKIHLEKRIPMGAGLGGGSSDAAEVLKFLRSLDEAPPSEKNFMTMGARLGADVPFFLHDERAMLAGGIGDHLTPIPIALDYTILIAKDPNVSFSTADAYDLLDLKQTRASTEYTVFFSSKRELSQLRSAIVNDFEPVLFAVEPKLKQLKDQLYSLGAGYASMTGSGSAFYAFFDDRAKAEAARTKLERERYFVAIDQPVSVKM